MEPFWGAYIPTNAAYWQNADPAGIPLFSLRFADPVYFGIAIAFVLVGWRKRWLTHIPLLLQSYPAAMQSHARYASVVFPAGIVASRLLAVQPAAVKVLSVTASLLWLIFLSALFAEWYRIF
jgi:hypothetical protein